MIKKKKSTICWRARHVAVVTGLARFSASTPRVLPIVCRGGDRPGAHSWGVFSCFFFFFQAEDGIRDYKVTEVQTCALPICDREILFAIGLHEPVLAGN